MKDRSDVYAIDDLIEKTRGIGKMKFANFLQFSFFFFILHVIPMRMNGKRWKNCDEGIRCKNEEDLKVPQSAMNMLNENVK